MNRDFRENATKHVRSDQIGHVFCGHIAFSCSFCCVMLSSCTCTCYSLTSLREGLDWKTVKSIPISNVNNLHVQLSDTISYLKVVAW